MTRPLLVLDRVLDAIEHDVAAHSPERGGALFGSTEVPLVCGFVHDRWAATTGASYNASRGTSGIAESDGSLEGAVRLIEEVSALRYRGTVHSHPGCLDRPSSQDLIAFGDSLRRNPWMADFLGPIVTREWAGELASHELQLPSGKISWFAAMERPSAGGLTLHRPVVRVLRLGEELDRFVGTGRFDVEDWQLSGVGGDPVLVATLRSAHGDDELAVRVWPTAHPVLPPLVTRTPVGASPVPVRIEWDHGVPAGDRLARALEGICRVRSSAAAPPAPAPAPSVAVESEERDGAGSRASAGPDVRAGLRARLGGLVPEALSRRRVLLAGAGSIGSQLAEGLVRSGVEDLLIIDPELVGAENLSRTVYVASDVDQPKVVALSRRLRAVNPGVRVGVHPGDVCKIDRGRLHAIVEDCDLVVAATDDVRAQAILDRLSYDAAIPAVFPGMYAGGRGGEIVFTVPGLSSCYRCATAVRHSQDSSVRPASDYGTKGRLAGEVALGSDIAHVTTAATKIALALLEREDEGRPLTEEFLVPGMAQGRERPATMVLFANVPSYSFFPKVFAGVPGQGAWQSVWLEVMGDPSCPTCGWLGREIDEASSRR